MILNYVKMHTHKDRCDKWIEHMIFHNYSLNKSLQNTFFSKLYIIVVKPQLA